MTQFVLVSPGQDQVVASGPQFGVKYTLVSNDGVRCVFNDPEDADYVGWLSNISGLDSPDLREAADDLVGDDGGVHGDFFYGRRPLVIEGQIESRPDNISRNVRMTRLQRASNATRQDATLRWMPEGGVEQIMYVRRQQPLRITGGYNKAFQLSLVSADPRIYGAEIKEQRITANTHVTVTNEGTMQTPPDVVIYGPATGIQVHNARTGEYVNFVSGVFPYVLSAGQQLSISFANRTVIRENGTNVYGQVQFTTSSWWQLAPGDNSVGWLATGTDANSSMLLRWRDAWV